MMIARHYDRSAIIDGEEGVRAGLKVRIPALVAPNHDDDDDGDNNNGVDDNDNDEEDEYKDDDDGD